MRSEPPERRVGATQSNAHQILVRISREEETLARRLLASTGPSIVCETDAELVTRLRAGGGAVRGIVWELSLHMPRRTALVPMEVVDASRSIPLILRIDWSPAVMRAIVATCETAQEVHIALCGFHDLALEVAAVLPVPTEPSAEQTIIRRVAPIVAPSAAEVVLLAVLAAKRRTTVDDLRRLHGSLGATLWYRLHSETRLTPESLLGKTFALHALWRRGVLGRSMKSCASDLGFSSSAALDKYVRRHARVRLHDVVEPDAFMEALDAFVECIRGDGPSGSTAR
jgi:hypothetical protein